MFVNDHVHLDAVEEEAMILSLENMKIWSTKVCGTQESKQQLII